MLLPVREELPVQEDSTGVPLAFREASVPTRAKPLFFSHTKPPAWQPAPAPAPPPAKQLSPPQHYGPLAPCSPRRSHHCSTGGAGGEKGREVEEGWGPAVCVQGRGGWCLVSGSISWASPESSLPTARGPQDAPPKKDISGEVPPKKGTSGRAVTGKRPY